MSHKAMMRTSINNRQSLLKTLDALGIKYQVAEKGNTLDISSRYNVKHKVNIALKSDCNGTPMSCIGFEQLDDGTFQAVGDFYEAGSCRTKQGQRISESTFKDVISSRYTYERIVGKLKNYGFQMTQDVGDWNNLENLNFNMQSGY